ncbi:MAG: MFS transporter, partial [Chloroflexi bacterium]|nr:MFS transporter [Chloroflexota bacterium]
MNQQQFRDGASTPAAISGASAAMATTRAAPAASSAPATSPTQAPAAVVARPRLRESLSILRLVDYRWLLIGNAMTFAGFQVRQMAQAWLVLEQTESALYSGLVNAMPGIAIICLSLFAGTLSDRMERWRII